MSAFDTALPILLHEEGGFNDDPLDPGGMTNLGVTKKVWDRWTGHVSDEAEMRALTPAKVAPLYRVQYWNALSCDQLPDALAVCVFDFAVNAGASRAARYLQQMVGAVEDGHIGPVTIAAVNAFVAEHGVADTVKRYQDLRSRYYCSLPLFSRYGRGWLNRVADVETAALRLA